MSRAGDWTQTFGGTAFWPLDPHVEDIDIRDVAHALSMQCRYGGHTRRFYSVAEHSVLMARTFDEPCLALWALLHDASEAYLVDVPRPIKRYLGGYRAYEARVMAAVCARFGLEETMPDEVAAADNAILNDEREQAMARPPMPWSTAGAPLGVRLKFWGPERARAAFLREFERLSA